MDVVNAVHGADGNEHGERPPYRHDAVMRVVMRSCAWPDGFELPPSLTSKMKAQQYPSNEVVTSPDFEEGDEEEASVSPTSVMHFKCSPHASRIDQPTGLNEWTARTPRKLRRPSVDPSSKDASSERGAGGTGLPAVQATPPLLSFSDLCRPPTPATDVSSSRLSSAGRAALQRARSGLSTDAPTNVGLLSSAGLAALQRARSSSAKLPVVKALFQYTPDQQDDKDYELRTEDLKADEMKPQVRAEAHIEAEPQTQAKPQTRAKSKASAKPQACEQMKASKNKETGFDTAIMKAYEKLAIANAAEDSKAKQEAELEVLALIAVIHRANKAKKVKELTLAGSERDPKRFAQDHMVFFLIVFAACFLWTVCLHDLIHASESEPDSAHSIAMRRAIERQGPWRWVFLRP
jgi:hypothetical protein